MKSGLVSVSFRQNTPDEILRACKACALDAVEWGSDVHAPANDPTRLRDIANRQAAMDIRCSSYGTYFRIGTHRPQDIHPYIRAAEILGTRTLRVWCGDRASSAYDSAARTAILEDCRALAHIAEEADVVLCTEFHHGTLTDRADSVLWLTSALGSSHFKTYWQPNQFMTAQENLASAQALGPITENIHVFNWAGSAKYPLAEGQALWLDYMAAFSQDGYALLEFMPDGRIESLPAEAAALQAILGGIE